MAAAPSRMRVRIHAAVDAVARDLQRGRQRECHRFRWRGAEGFLVVARHVEARRFEQAFFAVHHGHAESDGFNRLVLAASLLASGLPARAACQVSVRESLSYE